MNKIGILMLSNTKKRNWKKYDETYLFNSLNSIKNTLCSNYIYNLYIGIDDDDSLLINNEDNFKKMLNNNENINIKFIYFSDIKKGHVTKMWNVLHDIAYNNNCDYYYAMGDDSEFSKKGWVTKSINNLKKNNDIGIAGPLNVNGNTGIITQPFFSRKHREIFGTLFPEEIINWFCDNWINDVYKKYDEKLLVRDNEYTFKNSSFGTGGERYQVVNIHNKINEIVDDYHAILQNYMLIYYDNTMLNLI